LQKVAQPLRYTLLSRKSTTK